jgi:hypothetical protein
MPAMADSTSGRPPTIPEIRPIEAASVTDQDRPMARSRAN